LDHGKTVRLGARRRLRGVDNAATCSGDARGPEGERLITDDRTSTTRLSDDGRRLIIVERWLDWQVMPPRWRSKNRHIKLKPNEIEAYRQREGTRALPVDER
jgi:hypothetical protein